MQKSHSEILKHLMRETREVEKVTQNLSTKESEPLVMEFETTKVGPEQNIAIPVRRLAASTNSRKRSHDVMEGVENIQTHSSCVSVQSVRTLELETQQLRLEPAHAVQLEYEDQVQFDLEPEHADQLQPEREPKTVDQLLSKREPEHENKRQSELDPEHADQLQSESEPEPVDQLQSEREPESVDQLQSERGPEHTDQLQSECEPTPVDQLQSAVELSPVDQVQSEREPEHADKLQNALEPERTDRLQSEFKLEPKPGKNVHCEIEAKSTHRKVPGFVISLLKPKPATRQLLNPENVQKQNPQSILEPVFKPEPDLDPKPEPVSRPLLEPKSRLSCDEKPGSKSNSVALNIDNNERSNILLNPSLKKIISILQREDDSDDSSDSSSIVLEQGSSQTLQAYSANDKNNVWTSNNTNIDKEARVFSQLLNSDSLDQSLELKDEVLDIPHDDNLEDVYDGEGGNSSMRLDSMEEQMEVDTSLLQAGVGLPIEIYSVSSLPTAPSRPLDRVESVYEVYYPKPGEYIPLDDDGSSGDESDECGEKIPFRLG